MKHKGEKCGEACYNAVCLYYFDVKKRLCFSCSTLCYNRITANANLALVFLVSNTTIHHIDTYEHVCYNYIKSDRVYLDCGVPTWDDVAIDIALEYVYQNGIHA